MTRKHDRVGSGVFLGNNFIASQAIDIDEYDPIGLK